MASIRALAFPAASWCTLTKLGKPVSREVSLPHANADHSRCHECHIDVVCWRDQVERDVVTRREYDEVAENQIGGDVRLEDFRHDLIRNQHHHHIGLFTGFCDARYRKTVFFRLRGRVILPTCTRH